MNNRSVCVASFVLAALMAGGAASADGKIVIGHRGAAGYVAEHTLEGYALAYGMGADYIEPDVVLTKDNHFVCLHDIELDDTTNVAELFPDRKRDNGHWYAADFTLEEIKRLRAHERVPLRFPKDKLLFEVPTFEEMIELVQGLNKTAKRDVGIYPELKQPSWHEKQGLPMEAAFLAVLEKYGYKGKDAKVFVQCFEPEPLRTMRQELKSELPQILLIGGKDPFQPNLTAEGLDTIAEFANGIGPEKELVAQNPGLVKLAHERGLAVHPYTLRLDFFPSDKYADGKAEMKQFFFGYDVDGFFTDFPAAAAAVRDAGPGQ